MQLPPEISQSILSYLPVRNLLSCSLVSWDLHTLCQDEYLWKQLITNNEGYEDLAMNSPEASRMIEKEGYRKFYQHLHGLLIDLYIILGLRTEEQSYQELSDPSRIAHALKFSSARFYMVKISIPLMVETGDNIRGSTCERYLVYEEQFNCRRSEYMHRGVMRPTFDYEQLSLPELEEKIRGFYLQGFYLRPVKGAVVPNYWSLDSKDERVKRLVDFELLRVYGTYRGWKESPYL